MKAGRWSEVGESGEEWHVAVVGNFSNGRQDAAVMAKMSTIITGTTAENPRILQCCFLAATQ